MEQRLLEWVRTFLESRQFNRRFIITERRDGLWVCEAFTATGNKFASVEVANQSDAWRILMMMNGYSWDEPTQVIERQAA